MRLLLAYAAGVATPFLPLLLVRALGWGDRLADAERRRVMGAHDRIPVRRYRTADERGQH